MDSPLVSVCVPTYNSEKHIQSTLCSILNQTHRDMEVIVVDNHSTDSTFEIVSQLKDDRVKIYRNPTNLGGVGNWNRCIQMASGEYIAIYHSDDLYDPRIVEKQLDCFTKEVGAVFTSGYIINEDNRIIGNWFIPGDITRRERLNYADLMKNLLRYGNFLMCPSAIVKRSVYEKIGGFNAQRSGSALDLDAWLRIAKFTDIFVLDEPLVCYRKSRIQWTYTHNYLRTERSDFFNVMDNNLRDADKLPLNYLDLMNYNVLKFKDLQKRIINSTMRKEKVRARALLELSKNLLHYLTENKNIIKPDNLFWAIIFNINKTGGCMGIGIPLASILSRLLRWLDSLELSNQVLKGA